MSDNQKINYSLISAVREGRLEKVEELINSDGLSHSESGGYDLLCDALECRHTAIAKLLLLNGCEINSENREIPPSNTPLHFAVMNGDIEIVQMILNSGADIDAANQDGETPLFNAIEFEEIEITKLLLQHGACVNVVNHFGLNPLHVAATMGRGHVEFRLEHRLDIDYLFSSRWGSNHRSLHSVVERNYEEIIMSLLRGGVDIDSRGEDNITPLHIASKNGNIRNVEVLLNHGACIDSLTLKKKYTPLHFAIGVGNERIVELLLSRGADINARTNKGYTPLHIAVERREGTILKLLLKRGAEVDSQDRDGKTILHLAVEHGCLTIVKDVLKYCPDINNQSNRRSLIIAELGHVSSYKEIIEALLGYGFIAYPEDENDPTILYAAVQKGYLKIVEDLLKNSVDVNRLYNSRYENGLTPLHIAVKNKQEETAKLLICYGADINAQNKSRKTPIFYSIENADLKITDLLLTNGAVVKDYPELLHIAVGTKCIEIVKTLLQHGVDINARDKYGRTALHYTLSRNDEDHGVYSGAALKDRDIIRGKIAKLLLSKGANVDSQTKNGETTLHIAVKKRCVTVVEVLLKYNANVNSVGKNDVTPLHNSAKIRNAELCNLLLNGGACVNAKLKNGSTALHIASMKGNGKVVEVLLKHGAEVDSKIDHDVTPLHLAAEEGYVRIVKRILEFGADIDSTNVNGETALHIASEKGHTEVVEILLEYGSDINIICKNLYTPLDHANDKIIWFHNELGPSGLIDDSDYDDDYPNNYYDLGSDVCPFEQTAEVLEDHIIKMKIANLYVSEQNLESMDCCDETYKQDEYQEEIAKMKSEKIDNSNISFYDILTKSVNSLAICLRNANITQVLESDDYKNEFPLYASMIKCNFRRGMDRKKLLEQGNAISHILFNKFPELPYNCIETIFNYLNTKDFRILIDACEPFSISNPNTNTNVDDGVITPNISQV